MNADHTGTQTILVFISATHSSGIDIHPISDHQVHLVGTHLNGIDMAICTGSTQIPISSGTPAPHSTVRLEQNAQSRIRSGSITGSHSPDWVVGIHVRHLSGQGHIAIYRCGRGCARNIQRTLRVVAPGIYLPILGHGKATVIASNNPCNNLLTGDFTGTTQFIGIRDLSLFIHRTAHSTGHMVLGAIVHAPNTQLASGVITHGIHFGTNSHAGTFHQSGAIFNTDQKHSVVQAAGDTYHMLDKVGGVVPFQEGVSVTTIALEYLNGQTAIIGIPHTQLARGIEAPGKDSTIRAQRDRVIRTSRNSDHTIKVVAFRSTLALQNLLRHGVVSFCAIANTQLPIGIVAKAPDLATHTSGSVQAILGRFCTLGQNQSMSSARGNRYGELHLILLIQKLYLSGISPVVCIAQTQLTSVIITSSINGTVTAQHDQVMLTSGNGNYVSQILPFTIHISYPNLGRYGTANGGPIAQLAIVVQAPGPNSTVRAERCHKPISGSQSGHSNAHRFILMYVTLGNGQVNRTGVSRNGIGDPDHCRARLSIGSSSNGCHIAIHRNGSHRTVAGDPLEIVGICIPDSQCSAVHQQVERSKVGFQQIIPSGGIVHPEGVALLHGNIHGSQQHSIAEIAGIQSIGPLYGSGNAINDISPVNHQGLRLGVTHLNRLGSNLPCRDGVGAHNAPVIVGSHSGVITPGIYKAISSDHNCTVRPGRHGQHTLEIGVGVSIEGLAFQHRRRHSNGGKAGTDIMIDVPVICTNT